MSSEARRRLVCRCMGVSSGRVYAAVRGGGLAAVADVTKACRAGGGCGLCHPEIEEIVADVRGAPYDAALAIENQLVCRQETLARVEGSLASLVVRRLEPLGVKLASVSADGLCVRIAFDGPANGAIEALVAERLRQYVCDELVVEVEWRGC